MPFAAKCLLTEVFLEDLKVIEVGVLTSYIAPSMVSQYVALTLMAPPRARCMHTHMLTHTRAISPYLLTSTLGCTARRVLSPPD